MPITRFDDIAGVGIPTRHIDFDRIAVFELFGSSFMLECDFYAIAQIDDFGMARLGERWELEFGELFDDEEIFDDVERQMGALCGDPKADVGAWSKSFEDSRMKRIGGGALIIEDIDHAAPEF